MKFAIAITDQGQVIAASTDAAKVIAAYKAWGGPGQAWLSEKIHFDRVKRIPSTVAEIQTQPKIRPMKKTLTAAFAAIALSLFAFNASAQYVAVLSGGTNNVAGVGANTYSNYFDVGKQDNVAVYLSFAGTQGMTGTSNVTALFYRASSSDGLGDDTNNSATIVVAATSTNTQRIYTNIAVTGAQYLKLVSVANTNGASATNAITNLTIGYTVKQLSRP